MFAVVEIKGHQYKVEKGMKLNVEKIEEEEGKEVSFNKVLMTGEKADVTIGEPYVVGAVVTGKILKQFKDKKIRVFEKKAKKRYMVNKGHRQRLTGLEITDITQK